MQPLGPHEWRGRTRLDLVVSIGRANGMYVWTWYIYRHGLGVVL